MDDWYSAIGPPAAKRARNDWVDVYRAGLPFEPPPPVVVVPALVIPPHGGGGPPLGSPGHGGGGGPPLGSPGHGGGGGPPLGSPGHGGGGPPPGHAPPPIGGGHAGAPPVALPDSGSDSDSGSGSDSDSNASVDGAAIIPSWTRDISAPASWRSAAQKRRQKRKRPPILPYKRSHYTR